MLSRVIIKAFLLRKLKSLPVPFRKDIVVVVVDVGGGGVVAVSDVTVIFAAVAFNFRRQSSIV